MTTQQAAILRLMLIAAAWSLGAAAVYGLAAGGLGVVVPALFAAAAYLLTAELGHRGPARRDDVKYWRGRPVDDEDDRPRRLH